MVTSAIFAPQPGLIVPQETGAEKPEAECKSLDSTDSETIPSGVPTWAYVWSQISRSGSAQWCVIVLLFDLFAGALKTDHTEVLLSADFTGAIKVFINVKKYWALQRLLASRVQACLSEISPKDGGQLVRSLTRSPSTWWYWDKVVCSSCFGWTGTLKSKGIGGINRLPKMDKVRFLTVFFFYLWYQTTVTLVWTRDLDTSSVWTEMKLFRYPTWTFSSCMVWSMARRLSVTVWAPYIFFGYHISEKFISLREARHWCRSDFNVLC